MVSNHGNAAAHSLKAVLTVFGEDLKGEIAAPADLAHPHNEENPYSHLNLGAVRLLTKTDSVPPGTGVVWNFSRELPSIAPGSYPAILLVTYQDENSHPISAIACSVFKTRNSVPLEIRVSADDLDLKGKGVLEAVVNNLNATKKNISVILKTPNELKCKNRERSITLPPNGEKTVKFSLQHDGDLSGSHAVFCFVEYNQKDMHLTALAQAVVKARPADHWLKRTRSWWIGLDVLLIVLFILALFKNRTKHLSP